MSQLPSTLPAPTWPRAAIHDTVAAIAKQAAYRRDLGTTLLDRILQWLAELYRTLIESLGGVPHGRLVATLAAAAVALLIIARVVYAARLRSSTSADETPGAVARGGRSLDPWREAEAFAARGQFLEAAHALYRATIAMLAASGLVRFHESKTSGDYARELRRRGAASYVPFRRFGSRYDRIVYGAGSCDADGYAALLADARGVAAAREAERAA